VQNQNGSLEELSAGGAGSKKLWLGPFVREAEKAYQRARDEGVAVKRALTEGVIASFRDCWAPRKTIAQHLGISVRTVQRGITQARTEGRIGVARLKTNEVPPGAKGPLTCGGSHRWTIGWGKGNDDVKREVERARLLQLYRAATRTQPTPRARWLSQHEPPPMPKASTPATSPAPTAPARRYAGISPAQLDAELERVPRERTRDGPE
jgi:hypothetical protein